jgi:hypothetical protein
MKKILLMATLLLATSSVFAQFAPSTDNLRGLEGVGLIVMLNGYPYRLDDAQRPEILKLVEADATEKLQKAGITLFSKFNTESSMRSGSPKLVIRVTTNRDGMTPLETEVELIQKVRLSRDPTIETYAVTWSRGGIGGPKVRDSMIREQVAIGIGDFIRDYLSVNPQSAAAAKQKSK